MKIFSTDGIIYKILQGITSILKLNLLWMLFSLPIITLGGATIAAFDVSMKMVAEEEGYVGRDFLESFKKNFKCGIPYGLLLLFCSYVVWLDFSLFEQIEGNPMILLIAGMVSLFIFVLSFLYAFALQARYENTLINTLKNSANISMKYFVRTLTLLVALAVQLALFCWNAVTMFVGFLIGPACMIYTVSMYAKRIFAELEQ